MIGLLEKRGFSLVEALVYLAILGIFSVILTQIIIMYPKLNRKLSDKMEIIRLSRILDVKLTGLLDAVNNGIDPPYRLVMNSSCTVSNTPPISRCVEVYRVLDSQFWSNPTSPGASIYSYVTVYFDTNTRSLIMDPDYPNYNGNETILISATQTNANFFLKNLQDINFMIPESGTYDVEGSTLNIFVNVTAPAQTLSNKTITLRAILASSSPF